MNDDWRVHVRVQDEGAARELAEGLERFDLAHDLGGGYHDRVVASRDDADVFLYTATREQAEAAERAVRRLADREGWTVGYVLARWHPDAEEWLDPDVPLPASLAERLAEHAERVREEREESRGQGYPEYEVRVRCPGVEEARALSRELTRTGIRNLQRWQFVVVGAGDEDQASALAERLRAQAPAGSEVVSEGSVAWTVNHAPLGTPFNPFSVFGGLGG